MDPKKCFCCERSSHSLLTANCGHRTCFHCIKNSKPGHKCKKCNERGSQSLSPIKNKSSEKNSHLQSQETKHGVSYSPFMETDKYNPVTSRVGRTDRQIGETLMCPEHKEPLNMFCKTTKQILCSGCLCRKNRYSQQILPLRNAEEYLRKENRAFREEARLALSEIEGAWRTVNRNRQIMEQTIESHTLLINSYYDTLLDKLREMQDNSIRLCREYLTARMNEYGEISEDLNYLSETLKEYTLNSKDSPSVNELAYFYSSFNVIKKTMENLSFDYVSYEKREILLVQFDKQLTERVQRELIKFRFNLQVKSNDKNKPRSATKSPKKRVSPDMVLNTKHKIAEQGPSSKKHKFSLCSNGSVDFDNQDVNLYKRLLKAKYKF